MRLRRGRRLFSAVQRSRNRMTLYDWEVPAPALSRWDSELVSTRRVRVDANMDIWRDAEASAPKSDDTGLVVVPLPGGC